jgi:anti-sigma regulatory factor (Ser/Thr protein kinase)
LNDVDRQMHRFDVPADELASRQIRRALEQLDYDFDADTVELLKLVATELVTNAVRHSGTKDRIVVFVRVREPSLLLKVCDRGPGVERGPARPDPMAEGGRGLFLIDALASKWGTSRTEIDGQGWSCVWACFGDAALPECSSG